MAGWHQAPVFAGFVRSTKSVFVAATASVLLLSGCWLQVGHDATHRRFNADETRLTRNNVETLDEVWSVDVAGSVTEPMVSGNRAYVTWATSFPSFAEAGERALDANTGTTVWDTTFFSIGGRFLVSPVPGAFVGDQIWTGFTASTVLAPPACSSGAARIDSVDGTIVESTNSPDRSPAVAAGDVVVLTTSACGGIDPLSLEVRRAETGSLLWSSTLPADDFAPNLPTVVDDHIFVAVESTLYAFSLAGCNAATCPPVWSVDLGAPLDAATPVGGVDGQVFVTSAVSGAGELIALAATTGAELWRAPLAATSGDMAATGDTVFVTTLDTLQAFAAEGCGAATCRPLWTAPIGEDVTAEPVVAGGVVYVGTDGAVQAFDAGGCGSATCSSLIAVPVTGAVSSMSVAQGKLFVASATSSGGPIPPPTVTGHVSAFAPT